VKGDEITFDFSRSSAPVKGPLNGTISATVAAVFIALKHIFPEVPVNAGIFKPVKVIAPETTFLNAQYPKAVSGSSAEVSLRVVDAVFGAMAQAVPDRVPAACFGSVANFTISGFDPKRNKQYIMFRFSGGGYGGHPAGDGLSNGSAPISAARTSPIEVLEQLYPITFDSYRLRPGSGGAGEHRGGMGMEFQVRIRRGDALSSVLGDRGRYPPYGLHQGKDGQLAEVEYTIAHRRDRPEHVTTDEGVVLRPGDTARIATAGGGGWGNPHKRDPSRVLADAEHGYVTVAQARTHYGVALQKKNGGFVIDAAQTARLRGGARKAERKPARKARPAMARAAT
jgi:N-methylhydantoinase B